MSRRFLTPIVLVFTALTAVTISLPTTARGDIYVASFAANRVSQYTNAGATVNVSFISGLDHPNGLVLSGSDFYVSNSDSGTIGKYSISGATENAALISGLSFPTCMVISGSDIFVANAQGGTIGEYTTSGQTVNANLITGLNNPFGLALDSTGSDLFVSEVNGGRIGEYTTSGAVVNANLILNPDNPAGLAVSGTDLFVWVEGMDRVSKYTTSGALVNASLVTGTWGGASDLTVFGPDLFVSSENGTISEFTTSGDPVSVPFISSDLSEPASMVFTPEPGSAALIAAAGFGLLLRRSRFKDRKDD